MMELELIGAAMNCSQYLAGRPIVEIYLHVGVNWISMDGTFISADYLVFYAVDLDQLHCYSELSQVLRLVIKRQSQFKDKNLIYLYMRPHLYSKGLGDEALLVELGPIFILYWLFFDDIYWNGFDFSRWSLRGQRYPADEAGVGISAEIPHIF